MSLEVALFPCLSDNYGFLLHDSASDATAAIDTPDAKEIAKQCEARGWSLTEIWNTHWHPDHAGGNVALKRRYYCIVKGPDQAAIPARDETLSGGDKFDFAGHAVEVIHTPGHTDEHIIYHIPSAEIAFVGKAPGKYNLYLGGDGRGTRLVKLYRENIGEEQILEELEPLIEAYAKERTDGETFGDYLVRKNVVPAIYDGRDFNKDLEELLSNES